MRPRHLLTIAALLLAGLVPAGAGAAPAAEPQAPASPSEIVAYRDSGEWAADTADAIGRARAQIERHTRRSSSGRPALVLDVDDTSLSSYDCLAAKGFDRAASGACVSRARMPAITETLALYRFARERGVTVFFLTGRRQRQRAATTANLRRTGYTAGWRLAMRPNRERPGTHSGFKARRRRAIEHQGFRILANVGDQRSDLRGGHAMATFKLPNPMYLIATA